MRWQPQTAAIEPSGGGTMVELAPMTQSEYEAYLDVAVPEYARDNVESGYWSEERALELARESYDTLLPDGVRTADHHLFNIVAAEAGEKVGILWFGVQARGGARRAFVFDVRIYEPYRRRGYATQAFQALEARAREMGLARIMLHVFAHNEGARALYERLGFEVASYNMSRTLE
jgi:RimJ/RimL family protein N-acetyltransferase